MKIESVTYRRSKCKCLCWDQAADPSTAGCASVEVTYSLVVWYSSGSNVMLIMWTNRVCGSLNQPMIFVLTIRKCYDRNYHAPVKWKKEKYQFKINLDLCVYLQTKAETNWLSTEVRVEDEECCVRFNKRPNQLIYTFLLLDEHTIFRSQQTHLDQEGCFVCDTRSI